MSGGPELSDLVRRARDGDSRATNELFAAMYQDLRKLARARLRSGGRSVLLDTSALVNEWYVRFAKAKDAGLQNRTQLMRYASAVMRSIVVDFARRRHAARRGGGVQHLDLTVQLAEGITAGIEEVLLVHDALEKLARLDERMSMIVEMRYFGGMSESEIGDALQLSKRTVRREWSKARLWLAAELG